MSGLKMKYFVLKPQGFDKYAQASREALLKYAEVIRKIDRQLAAELEEWVENCRKEKPYQDQEAENDRMSRIMEEPLIKHFQED